MVKDDKNDLEYLSTEQLEQILRERKSKERSSKIQAVDMGSDASNRIDGVANNVFNIIAIVIVLLILFFIFIPIMSGGSSSNNYGGDSSSNTDWNAYCRDMFPGNDEMDRAAREGCVRGGEVTDNLIDGKYDK